MMNTRTRAAAWKSERIGRRLEPTSPAAPPPLDPFLEILSLSPLHRGSSGVNPLRGEENGLSQCGNDEQRSLKTGRLLKQLSPSAYRGHSATAPDGCAQFACRFVYRSGEGQKIPPHCTTTVPIIPG